MNSGDLYNAIGGIDDKYIEDADAAKGQSARVMTFAPWPKWAMPAAACLALAVSAFALRGVVFPQNSGESGTPGYVAGGTNTGGADSGEIIGGALEGAPNYVTIDSIKGLPTGDYTWDEGGGVAADRLVTNELRYLMRAFFHNDSQDTMAAFAVVRADSVKATKDGQIATCSLPSVEFMFGDSPSETFTIEQQLYGGCTNDEQTNLLRVGGVYVLPLVKFESAENWNVYGDLDCLFEVDDKGLLHSHSLSPALNKYDGIETAYLYKDVTYLYKHPILVSRFAEYILQGYYIDTAGATIAFIEPNGSWYEEDAPNFTAKVGADGKITPADGEHNVFAPVAGMTLDEMNAAIREIKEYAFEGKHQYGVDAFEADSQPPSP
ncbi:MAG: hypothetical protein LBK75_01300 [Oscillospiraceae bacterium]|jgi:hypothetical protein|nr:hypothetical protein [Oscillospiraceae bacterium]